MILQKNSEQNQNGLFPSIKDTELRILFLMGLTLRKPDKQNKILDLENLKRKIIDKYDTRGLHISQAVQNGIFSKYVGNILDSIDVYESEDNKI